MEINSWDNLDLKTELQRGIYSYGFEEPSEIQKKAILPIISGKDTIAQGQSGSGKTGAFTISTLQIIDVTLNETQAFILAPTRELAKQISNVIDSLAIFIEGLRTKILIGGSYIQKDAEDIRKSIPHIIIGCPGRLLDIINRRYLNAHTVKLVVLDEADEMLSQGFKPQIYNIFQYFNENIQVALFSATMPKEMIDLTEKFMRNPTKICIKKEELTLECIQQYYVALQNDHHKYDMLKTIFSSQNFNQTIIYCNSVKRVADLHSALLTDGFSVCSIHSSMDKQERDASLLSFRSGTYRLLVSSNITSRGIDIQQLGCVINFDIPKCVHNYLHRIGRSGRWGRKGMAINFITKRDVYIMKNIEDHYKIEIEELPLNM
jgi:translation initiation factor 4A